MLGLTRQDASRKTSIEYAIIKYRACIRNRQFLSQDTGTIVGTNGEVLNKDLLNLKTCLREKRKLYWMMVREGTPLQSIRYPNVEMIPTEGEDDEEIVCHGLVFSPYVDPSDVTQTSGTFLFCFPPVLLFFFVWGMCYWSIKKCHFKGIGLYGGLSIPLYIFLLSCFKERRVSRNARKFCSMYCLFGKETLE